MIEILNYSDEAVESELLPVIEATHTQIVKLIDIPEHIVISFKDNGSSDETGVGGFTFSERQINLAFAKDFPDKDMQIQNLRSTLYHESFHVRQGFTFEDSPFTALESAVYEGCAVVFERDYALHTPPYANYQQYSEAELESWLSALRNVGSKYFEDVETWHTWAFYNKELDTKWIIYKVGTWLIDKTLQSAGLSVVDLQSMTAEQILELGKL